MQQRKVARLFGPPKFEYVEIGEDSRYSVDMIITLSETDRAVIREHQLYGIVLQEEPMYTKHDIVARADELDEQAAAARHPVYKAIQESTNKTVVDRMRGDKRVTRVGDLLKQPFSRDFKNEHSATEYADKLKTIFLPRLKELIEKYRDHKRNDTLEF